ncbi:dnaJ homolog subfamily B member 13-like [Nilaparvata lugens]|uniref:dnaJ homolog subfamily B member 13-like n=1 Tax=Nilaparvata lugens TaxID=108931 RepID=UPI00193D1733|nr:dnaJ homolog subfamily B member 13-like [Nilaparvata lugens]
MGIDYYGVLGLTRNCDDLQIKKAYRKRAIETNPERNAGGALKELFVLIGEAYDVLSQPKWRAVYDQYGEEGMKKGVPSPQGWIPPYAYHGDPVRTYQEFFGTSSPYADILQLELPTMDEWRGRALKKKGPPLVQPLQLTLKELYLGAIKKMKIKRRVFADNLEETTIVKYEVLTIPIRPGLPPGTEIVFPEKGDCGHSTIPGDIIFVTEDLPHSNFRREGINLLTTVDIDLQEALTGKTIDLETLDQRQIRVPITQVVYQDYVKVVHSEGMPYVDDPDRYGDLLIDFRIKFPVYLPEESKRFIKRAMAMPGTDGQQLADLVLQYIGPKEGSTRCPPNSLWDRI